MLNSGIKLTIEATRESVLRCELVANFFEKIFSVGIDLKAYELKKLKKPYSIRYSLGPVFFCFVNIKEMNKHFDEFVEKSSKMDFTEM